MTNEQSFAYADRIDRDPYTSSQSRERALNTARPPSVRALRSILRSSTPFTPMTSRQAAKPGKNQFVERAEYARFSSTSLSRFT